MSVWNSELVRTEDALIGCQNEYIRLCIIEGGTAPTDSPVRPVQAFAKCLRILVPMQKLGSRIQSTDANTCALSGLLRRKEISFAHRPKAIPQSART